MEQTLVHTTHQREVAERKSMIYDREHALFEMCNIARPSEQHLSSTHQLNCNLCWRYSAILQGGPKIGTIFVRLNFTKY